MSDAQLVRRFERLCDLLGNRQRLVEWNGSLGEAIREPRPSTNSMTKRRRAGRIVDAIDVGDVGMVQRNVVTSAEDAIRVGQDFERNVGARASCRAPDEHSIYYQVSPCEQDPGCFRYTRTLPPACPGAGAA